MAGVKTIVGLAFVLACGFLLVILSCALYNNWYPLLVVTTYVLAPFPNFMCARCAGGGDDLMIADSSSGFQDAGRFLTSIFIVTGFGLPLVLAHAGTIGIPAMILSIAGGLLVYGTIIAYSRLFASDGDPGFY